MYNYNTVSGEASHSNRSCYASSGGNSLFPVGGQSLLNLNFRQNFQISDNPPPPFALEKAVFSPLLGQNFRKFLIIRQGGGGGGGRPPAPPRFPPLYASF
jgi:hypothetical protein